MINCSFKCSLTGKIYVFLTNYGVREKLYNNIKERFTLSFWKLKYRYISYQFSVYLRVKKNGTSLFAFYKGLQDGLSFCNAMWYQIHFIDKNIVDFHKEFNSLYERENLLGKFLMNSDLKRLKLTYAYAKSSHLL